jgi:hypothetical protein
MSEYEGGIHRINDLLDRHESRPRQDSKSG